MTSGLLKNVVSHIGSGITPSRSNKAYWEMPMYPWLKTEQLGEYKIFDTNEYISQAALDETSIKLWPPKTLSVALYGEGQTRGKTSIIMREMATNQACCNIIIDESKADYRYVYYWLKNNYIQLRKLSSGVRKNLNSDDIKSFPIRYPSVPQQALIADVLCGLDEKIALNKQINAELEAMAKIIYDYWFVQFDFPDENGKPYRTSGGTMEWNEQLNREIPKGWDCSELGEFCSFRNGINYEKNVLGDKKFRIVNVRNISASSFLLNEDELDEIYLPSSLAERYLLSYKDVIIARSGTPGATRLLMSNSNMVIFCGFIICGTPHNENAQSYLSFFLKGYEGTSVTKTGGSILQNVSQDTLKSIVICMPPDSILLTFNVQIKPIIQMLQEKIEENNVLTRLRDWLLPLLMNGQATVK